MSKFLKIATICLTVIMASQICEAKGPRFRYGVSWGYSGQVADSYDYTYRTSVGYRVSSEQPLTFNWYSNAFISADAGIEFLRYLALTAKAGYCGVSEGFRVLPVELQLAFFLKGYENDGLFIMGAGGMAFTEDLDLTEYKTNTISAGLGYRHNLAGKVCLDGFLRVRETSCSPLPTDDYEGTIPRDRTVYSRAEHIAVELGISLYF